MKETPLAAWHRAHGARMVEFAGWAMPLDYGGILAEHHAVRTAAGVFDVSHMSEFLVRGPDAAAFLDRLVTNWPGRLQVGAALYTPMCYPDGGTVDDLVIYRTGPDAFGVVGNAGTHDQDWAWLRSMRRADEAVELWDVSDQVGLVALQGPQASAILGGLAAPAVADLPRFGFRWPVTVAGVRTLVSRTGYTGEDGFEIFARAEDITAVFERLVEAGARPAGLGARDTLRLEARLPLYGHELAADITPLEAGLKPFVRFDKPVDFVGRAALEAQHAAGPPRRLVGLFVDGGIARAGYPVGSGAEQVGRVTSGTQSPTLGRPIALALVDAAHAALGTTLWVEIRGRRVPAVVTRLPFVKREGSG
ncbi:MAG: glycine cleavage system aminomethyltransferase GcvT [Actinomycetia bacterium]|nr:glycine cleavage system aminomethyltransferase GcvT [Actinomycetes bacterium]